MSVRAGVVGLGFGEKIHVPGLRRAGAEVVAVCARHGADDAAERLGVPRSYVDWEALAADEGVELVSIASPPATHRDIALSALAAGKAVLCEKPLGVEVADAEEMTEAAREAGALTLVDFEFRGVPAFARAAELMATSALGDVYAAEVRWTLAHHTRPPGPAWKDERSRGGGTLLSLGIHTLDYLEWLLGPVIRLRGTLEHRMGALADSGCEADLELASGAPVHVLLSAAADEPAGHTVILRGTAATLELENLDLTDYMRSFRLVLDGDPLVAPEPTDEDGRLAPFAAVASRLVESLRGGGTPEPSFAEGLRAQRLAAAIEESHAGGGAWLGVDR